MPFRVRVVRCAGCVLLAVFLGTLPLSWSTHAAPQTALPPEAVGHKALFDRYCLTCHNQRQKERGTTPIALDTLDVTKVGADAETWEKVVLKLRAGLMPPAGRPRPDKPTHDAFAGWLEAELDRDAAARPNPGRTEPFHRLNRAEYRNVVRDLLDLDVDVASLLPADDVSSGFDNIASVMTMSPTLMDRYLVAAQKVRGWRSARRRRCRTSTTSGSRTICRRTTSCPACRSARAAARASATPSRGTVRTSIRPACARPE